MKIQKLLVVASTFPSSETDPVPAFVRDQVIAIKKVQPDMQISVLAPHDKRSNTKSVTEHPEFTEYRFHYAWPANIEKLAGRGIMPALKANPLNYFLIPFLFIGEFIALLRLEKKIQPDVVYAHWFTPQAFVSRWVRIFTHTPFVFTTHASDVSVWKKIPILGNHVVRSNTKQASAFTAVSRRSMEKLESFFVPKDLDAIRQKSTLIPMGISLPQKVQTTNTNPHQILFVGRLVEKKGVHYLLPAFAEVAKQFPDASLVVAGDGMLLEGLKKQANEMGIAEKVTFPGYVSGEAKQQLLQSAGIYVVPSVITQSGDAEGLPVSLMEGLSYGKICIATNESGADDILHDGQDGYLIPQKDTAAITSALTKALSLQPNEANQIRQNAVTTAAQFDWPRIALAHLDFFESKLN
jgi:glycosyltransferase involved in cell wall biosynthesis